MGSTDPQSTSSSNTKEHSSTHQNGHVDTNFEADGSLAGFGSLEQLLEVSRIGDALTSCREQASDRTTLPLAVVPQFM